MIRFAAILSILVALWASASAHSADSSKPIRTKKMTITEVLQKHTDDWMKIPGVIGTGEGQHKGKPAIIVFIEKPSDKIKKGIPKSAGGYPVVLETTGTIKAQ